MKIVSTLCPHQQLIFLDFLVFSYLMGMKWYFIWFEFDSCEVNLFICLLVIHFFFYLNCQFMTFVHFWLASLSFSYLFVVTLLITYYSNSSPLFFDVFLLQTCIKSVAKIIFFVNSLFGHMKNFQFKVVKFINPFWTKTMLLGTSKFRTFIFSWWIFPIILFVYLYSAFFLKFKVHFNEINMVNTSLFV